MGDVRLWHGFPNFTVWQTSKKGNINYLVSKFTSIIPHVKNNTKLDVNQEKGKMKQRNKNSIFFYVILQI